MAELIRKDKLIDWTYRVPKYYDSMNDRTDMRDFINELPTTTEAEIRAMAIDEFAEKLGTEFSEQCGEIKVEGITYDILTLDSAIEIMWEIAEQLKEE